MPRPATVVATVLGLVAAGSSFYAWQLSQRLAETEAALTASQAREARHQAAAPTQSGPSENPTPAPARNRPETPGAQSDSARGPSGPGPERGGGRGPSAELRQLMAIQRRSALDGRYATLFRQLHLSPAQLEKFQELLLQRQSTPQEVFATAREQGLDFRGNREQMQKLVQDLQNETDASIASLLGAGAYQQYQQYEQTQPQRTVVSRLEQRLSYSAAPLYGNQAEQLVTVLAANPSSSTAGTSATFNPADPTSSRLPRISDAAIAQSQGFLSAPQVEALRQLQQEQIAQAKLLQQMQAARRAGGGANATPVPPQ